jgi:flagellar basal body rod protein FlgB
MDAVFHPLSDLFAQLGLPNSAAEIDAFVARHAPLASSVALADAPFWTASQVEFLREALEADADWAEAVDHLDAQLRVGG